MAERPPDGYLPIASALSDKGTSFTPVNLIGIVGDFLPPTTSRGDDSMTTFVIHDASTHVSQGLRVRWFGSSTELPKIESKGDVVLLRGVILKDLRGQLMAVSSKRADRAWIVFPKAHIAIPQFRHAYAADGGKTLYHLSSVTATKPKPQELQWVIAIHDKLRGYFDLPPGVPTGPASPRTSTAVASNSRSAQANASSTPSQPVASSFVGSNYKDALLRDIQPQKFYNFAVEIVKVFFNDMNGLRNYLEVYVTDYTSNVKLEDRKSETEGFSTQRAWRGPFGRMTLKVEVHEPHATWIRENSEEGSFVTMHNVRIKLDGVMQLEGSLWPEKLDPSRIYISRLNMDSERYVQLAGRKQEYQVKQGLVHQVGISKDPARSAISGKDDEGSRVPKTGKNKRRKEKLKLKAGQAIAQQSKPKQDLESAVRGADTFTSNYAGVTESAALDGNANLAIKVTTVSDEANSTSSKRQRITELRPFPQSNAQYKIRPMFEAKLSTFNELVNNPHRRTKDGLALPFVNTRHRVKLRVVDFFPHDICDFLYMAFNKGRTARVIPCWRFVLTVKAGDENDLEHSSINVVVDGDEANTLLGEHPRKLERGALKQDRIWRMLNVLWGDLAEKKDNFLRSHPKIEADEHFSAEQYNIFPDNSPFEACILEYGIPGDVFDGGNGNEKTTYERMYKLFGTKIVGAEP